MFSEGISVATRGTGEQGTGRGGGRFEARVADVDLAARARLVRLRGADDAGAARHLFFFASCVLGRVWQRFLGPARARLIQLAAAAFFFLRGWRRVLASCTRSPLTAQPTGCAKPALRRLGLLTSVSQYASSAWLPNLEEVLAAACCGARFRCKRSLWPSTHADQPWVDALRLWWTSAAKQINRSLATHGGVGLTRKN